MLEELHVRNLALIDEVWLGFANGMTVLTGETGAGKTALVGALKLLVGERADAMLVKSGAAEALVEGRFVVDGVEVVARRRVGADGRSRCTIDEEMSTVSALASRLGPLVDLHGQHDHQALLSPASHASYLDRHAGAAVSDALSAYRHGYECYAAAVKARDERREAMADSERQADYLRFVVSEIADTAVRAGEDAELQARLPGLRHAERLTEAVGNAVLALRGEGGASDSVALAAASLAKVTELDPALDMLAERLADVDAGLGDIGISMREYGESLEHNPIALDDVEARLATLAALKKKYGPTLEDVVRTHDEAVEAPRDPRSRGRSGLQAGRGGRRFRRVGAARCGVGAGGPQARGRARVRERAQRCERRSCDGLGAFRGGVHRPAFRVLDCRRTAQGRVPVLGVPVAAGTPAVQGGVRRGDLARDARAQERSRRRRRRADPRL